jgi:hypothetical protein
VVSGRWSVVTACALAVLAVLPLLVPALWVGLRLGMADTALGVIAPTEQPLSVRSPGGPWAIGLALAWFALAYWQRKFAWWEAGLVAIGTVAALARLGNAWVDALALVVPLARQVAVLKLRPVTVGGVAALCVAAGAVTLVMSRPPELPAAAAQAALATSGRGNVMADWRWAAEVQKGVGGTRRVWAANGLQSESQEFWLDYLRVAQGHVRWEEILRQKNVDLVVLDAAGQQRQAADLVRASAHWRVTFDADGVLIAERIT